MIEIETRAVIADPAAAQAKLLELGYSSEPTYEQLDIMFDHPDASLFRSGQKIRIRLEKGSAELTYKGLFQGDASASRRTEINLGINQNQIDDYRTLLEALGYPMCFQICKNRTLFKKANVKVTFDNWPIIGCLVEIEGSEDDVKAVASEIAPSVLFKNYRLKELLKEVEIRSGKSLSQLKTEHKDRTGFDLGKIELLAS